jgi:hypothetical protein
LPGIKVAFCVGDKQYAHEVDSVGTMLALFSAYKIALLSKDAIILVMDGENSRKIMPLIKYIRETSMSKILELCDFDGVGFALKKEHWDTVLKNVVQKGLWRKGENGVACLGLAPISEPPLPKVFYKAAFLALGNFQNLEDTVNPEKIRVIYVVDDWDKAWLWVKTQGGEKTCQEA